MDPLAHHPARPKAGAPTAETSVEALFARWPEAVPLFVSWRLACPGCDMAPFCRLNDVATNYRLEMDSLLAAVTDAIEGSWHPEMKEDEWKLD